MLRRCTNADGSINDVRCAAEQARLAARLRKSWCTALGMGFTRGDDLTIRKHEPVDCVHYSVCLAKVARVKHARVRVVPCAGCERYEPESRESRDAWLKRSDWEPGGGV